jgi:hypothetical protein
VARFERYIWLGASSFLLLLAAYGLRDQWPFFGVLLIGAFVLCMLFFKFSDRYSMIAYNAGFAFLVLGLGEAYFAWKPGGGTHHEGTYNDNYFAEDKELGYGLSRSKRTVTSTKKETRTGATLYDVRYQINEKGFREVPSNGDQSPVFFFGDSFTFGEGVNDDGTLPAQFAKLTGRKAFNFAVHGYGPHQFLRMLELKRLEELGIKQAPRLVVYTILPTHVERAAKASSWDKDGPLYELSPSGLVYRGSFQTQWRPFVLHRSTIYQAIRDRVTEAGSRQRVLEILKRSRQLISERYGADMLVVIWDVGPPAQPARTAWLAENLSKAGIANLPVSSIAPLLEGADYYIPGDGHPLPKTHAAVANAIAARCGEAACSK